MTFKEKVQDKLLDIRWFFRDIKISIESFFIGLSNFWYYRKLIYKDRWYDHDFLIKFITIKMKQMEENWDDSHYIGSDFTKRRMCIIRKNIEDFEESMDKLVYDYIVNKKYTKEEFKVAKDKIMNESFSRLGRNIQRFWD